ncbi:MAG: carbon-monoxide dehydrogenase catalytic subunit [Alphaproteobacteria bacterium CG_4_10_14_0_2_um_filter_63_37]|nr:MAG: carbon-monoxide dehydrogenase catalytic subunit [Proteobacteria bacterium CG1_02_64_396]PJA23574.1 MAG: carbon-monoxide dehydrogenase catalytic subunit [Alphaproteobacteria bacterium CG_4_10_14_0_2_um_filter_63_37]
MKPVSIPVVERSLLDVAHSRGFDTARERLAVMSPQCGFGELGTCCRTCYMGPCRIDPFGNGPSEGICGLNADAMVARNLLRETVGGAASHVGHARHLVLTLRNALDGKAPYSIKSEAKVLALAKTFGVQTEGRAVHDVCRDLVNIALEDFGRQDDEPNNWLSKRAPAQEQELWKNLGLMYSNPHNEIETAMHATSMGNDADPVTLMMRVLKMSLVDGWTGLTLCTDIQDILFGIPEVAVTEASVGVLEERSVNIAAHGHNPVLSEKILEWADKMQGEAVAAGAEGINVVGVCCTGNELGMRHGVKLAAHNSQTELILTTGAVDAMVVDIQCIWPQLAQVAKCFDTAFITTDEMVHIPDARHIPFEPVHADESAQEIIRTAIACFKKRQGKPVDIPQHKSTAIAGLSVEAIVDILSKVDPADPLKPVIDNVANGNIHGFAGVVGCSSIKFRDGAMTEEMVKALLAQNVLVCTTGCTAHICGQAGLLTGEATLKYAGDGLKAVLTALGEAAGLGGPLPPVWHMGSCVDNSRIVDLLGAVAARLGVKVGQLPAVGSAPELVQEKAVSIGGSFLGLGVSCHIAPAPRILGAPMVTQLLTKDLQGITGAVVRVELEAHKAADWMVAHIGEKRTALGLG